MVTCSGSFIAEIFLIMPRKLFIFMIKKNFSGLKYPTNILFNFEKGSTGHPVSKHASQHVVEHPHEVALLACGVADLKHRWNARCSPHRFLQRMQQPTNQTTPIRYTEIRLTGLDVIGSTKTVDYTEGFVTWRFFVFTFTSVI